MRLPLTSSLVLTLLFTACIGIIRAQPYDNGELRAFLKSSDDCSVPCFMGIRPGMTTLDEAIAALAAHEWVRALDLQDAPNEDRRSGTIWWSWSGAQPDYIYARLSGRIELRDEEGDGTAVVTRLEIPTTIPFADLYILLGTADATWLVYDSLHPAPNIHTAVYDGQGIQLQSYLAECPLRNRDLIYAPVFALSFGSIHQFPEDYYTLDPGIVYPHYRRDWLKRFPGCYF
jgi:hypothetical protein